MRKEELMAAVMNGTGAKRPSEDALKKIIHDISDILCIAPGDSSTLSNKVARAETLEKKQNTRDIWQHIDMLKDRGYATHTQIRSIFHEEGEEHLLIIAELLSEMNIKIFEHDPTEDDLALLALSREEVSDDIIELARILVSVDNKPSLIPWARRGFFIQPNDRSSLVDDDPPSNARSESPYHA